MRAVAVLFSDFLSLIWRFWREDPIQTELKLTLEKGNHWIEMVKNDQSKGVPEELTLNFRRGVIFHVR